MHFLFGDKELFAIEIEFLELEPSLYGRSAVWLGGERIGKYMNDENVLGPFMSSLMRIANNPEYFWVSELEGLNSKEAFLKSHPFWFDPDSFSDATEEEIDNAIKYDAFLMQWGENFDQCVLTVIIRNEECTFFYNRNRIQHIDEIKFIRVPLRNVRDVYEKLYTAIPSVNWPSKLPKPFSIKER